MVAFAGTGAGAPAAASIATPDVPPTGPPAEGAEIAGVGRRPADSAATVAANRRWWDSDADAYQAEHGAFLGDADFVWCPERLREQDARLLGNVAGKRVLEVGCGAAMCSRFLREDGAHVVAFDLSAGMLRQARAGAARTRIHVPLVQADAQRIPFRSGTFDIAFTAFGAIQFVADSARLMREVARVLRPGGRWVFATTHPTRWAFPDDPGPDGLRATMPYWDRTPYVEYAEDGTPLYVEHHRTLGDRMREITSAGMQVTDIIEPEWPEQLTQVWGQWSPLRGAILPGTAIYVCRKLPPPTE